MFLILGDEHWDIYGESAICALQTDLLKWYLNHNAKKDFCENWQADSTIYIGIQKAKNNQSIIEGKELNCRTYWPYIRYIIKLH